MKGVYILLTWGLIWLISLVACGLIARMTWEVIRWGWALL